LLFIERYEQGTDIYHIPRFVRLDKDVNLEALESAFNVVIDRHPVLKSVYLSDDQEQDYQTVLDAQVDLSIEILSSDEELLSTVQTEIARAFDLNKEPSIRLRGYAVGEHQYLLILWHHIAFDGWSSGVFMQELSEAYEAICADREAILPELGISYADYATWQRD